jgi:hypothetical protein
MEVLLTIAAVLIFGSILVVAANTALQGSSQSFKAVSTAAAITGIDRHIRESVNSMHIPYWANPLPYIEEFNAELYRSEIGSYINSIITINDRNRNPRGIEVIYTVNNREMRTIALFPSIVIVDMTQ